MIQTAARVAALFVFAVIVYVTISPINLRPATGLTGLEREAAYALLGLTLAVAFPARMWIVTIAIVVIAGGLELAQHLTPDRHGRLIDAVQKAAGGLVGMAIGYLFNRFGPH
jgi:hypothetical protein